MTTSFFRSDRRERSPEEADHDVAERSWHDAKRYLWLLPPAAPGMVFLSWLMVWSTGVTTFWWLAVVLAFVIMPLADQLLGPEPRNRVPDAARADLDEDRYYRFATHMYLPLQYLALIFACWLWAGGGWVAMSFTNKLGLMFAVGTVGGIANNAAHELGHRHTNSEKWLSKIALAPSCYGHFYVEHNRGHHMRVATVEDPASARLGESVYFFTLRSVFNGSRSAWRLESDRLTRHGKSRWSVHNHLINAWLLTVLLFITLSVWFRPVVLPWLLGQAVIGIFLLEAMNYLSHYGLRRQKLPSGRYERVRPSHSWNSNTTIVNIFLLHLQRHSDHHAAPSHRYQAVRHAEDAPQLPGSYGAMITLTLIPPLWRKVMDHRVLAVYDGDIRRTALSPRDARRLLG